MLMEYPDGDGYVQQDIASCHIAGIVRRWFKDPDRDFISLSWFVKSSDSNPIENLWDEVERGIRQLNPVSSNLKVMKSSVFSEYSLRLLIPSINIS
ncbi:hypothetical protein TNCV_4132101 [Trichonephila clavipes]|nr:hypothetical protein TNCV_4132101 [Trichonephila clavipes]